MVMGFRAPHLGPQPVVSVIRGWRGTFLWPPQKALWLLLYRVSRIPEKLQGLHEVTKQDKNPQLLTLIPSSFPGDIDPQSRDGG